jgi:hypothetical protein
MTGRPAQRWYAVPTMELARLLDELTRAAERAGITVRTESFDPNLSDVKRPRGGLCTLRGARLILVDAKLPLPEQIATIAEALAGVDLEHLFLTPVVRATIGAYAPVGVGEGEGERLRPALPVRTKPGLKVVRGSRR